MLRATSNVGIDKIPIWVIGRVLLNEPNGDAVPPIGMGPIIFQCGDERVFGPESVVDGSRGDGADVPLILVQDDEFDGVKPRV